MNKYKYMINEKLIRIDNVSRISYGIDIFEIAEGTPILLFRINDISTDKTTVEELAKKCSSLNASPIHIFEIIEDIL